MNSTLALHQPGERFWLDDITRTLLRSGTLAHYIRELSVTGLTSNPTILEHGIGAGDSYDVSIRVLAEAGWCGDVHPALRLRTQPEHHPHPPVLDGAYTFAAGRAGFHRARAPTPTRSRACSMRRSGASVGP